MEFTYKNRKHIARIALALLVILLLSALGFKILGGTYSQGNVEEIVFSQSKELGHCILSNDYNHAAQIKHLLDGGFACIVAFCVLLSLPCFILICRGHLFGNKGDSLVSLRVRMNE